MGTTSPTVFSESPELLRGLAFLLQSLGFCVARIECSGSLPCHPRRLGLTTSWETERRNLEFSLGSSLLNSPQGFISVQPSLVGQEALAVGALHSRSEKKTPALLTPPGKTGPHWDGTLPSAHHPETGLAGNGAGREEGRAV